MFQRIGNAHEEDLKTLGPLVGLFEKFHGNQPTFDLAESLSEIVEATKVCAFPWSSAVIGTTIAVCAEHGDDYKDSNEVPLSSAEIAAIAFFSAEFGEQEGFYSQLNTNLRQADRQKLKGFVNYIWLLMHALSKCPTSPCRMVFRGIKLATKEEFDTFLLAYKAGKKFTWYQFSSCTCNVEVLSSEQFLGMKGWRILFSVELTTNRGRDISQYSLIPNEKEVLLPANSRFIVIGHLAMSGDQVMIQLREVDPLDPIIVFPTAASKTPPSTPDNKASQEATIAVLQARIAQLESVAASSPKQGPAYTAPATTYATASPSTSLPPAPPSPPFSQPSHTHTHSQAPPVTQVSHSSSATTTSMPSASAATTSPAATSTAALASATMPPSAFAKAAAPVQVNHSTTSSNSSNTNAGSSLAGTGISTAGALNLVRYQSVFKGMLPLSSAVSVVDGLQPGSGGALAQPQGVAVLSTVHSKLLFVSDTDHHRLQVYDVVTGAFVRTIGTGSKSSEPEEFYSPRYMTIWDDSATSGKYFLVVTDNINSRVKIIDIENGDVVSKIIPIRYPRGVAVLHPRHPGSSPALLYIAEEENSFVSVFELTTMKLVKKIGDDDSAANRLNNSQGIALLAPCNDSQEPRLFVCDSNNSRCQVYHALTGEYLSTLGASVLNRPCGATVYSMTDGVNSQHFLYIADRYRDRIFIFNAVCGDMLYEIGTRGKKPGEFDFPVGIAVCPNTSGQIVVFVTDRDNNRVQSIVNN